jgi:hypothetical protein
MNFLKPILTIVFQLIIFTYILALEREKCACSKNWMRKFIKIMSYILIVINVILILLINNDPKLKIVNIVPYNVLMSIIILYLLIGLFYSVTCIVYFFRLHSKTYCECSDNWKKYLLLLPIIGISMAFITILFMLIFLVYFKLQK